MKILGYTYKLKKKNDSEFLDAMGRFHSRTQAIFLATDQNKEQKMSTVLHEIIEALNYHLELKLDHNVIMSLEASLYQVLNDNGVDLSPLLKDEPN